MSIGLLPPKAVRVGMPGAAPMAISSDDLEPVMLADASLDHSLSVEDESPRALALHPEQSFGMAFAGDKRFTAVSGRQGARGPQGIPGPAGGSSLQRTAGETLSALRAVYELDGLINPLDYRDTEHIDLLLGITLTAAPAGEPVNVQRSGVIEDAGWSWTPGRVWLGSDGRLTQTPPADGYDVLIGAATSATSITLNLTDPIELE